MNEAPLDASSNHDLIDELADEFLSRIQAGESPTVSEYCQRHPQLAEPIRELFVTLKQLEDAKTSRLHGTALTMPMPERIGHYHLIRRIGLGGMGVVYEARHEDLDRPVALKVLSQRHAHDQRALVRFQREGRAIANLHHTNIVPLYEVGTEGGFFFLAMQLIVGRSLDQVIESLRSDDAEGSRTRSAVEAPAAESFATTASTVDAIPSPPHDPALLSDNACSRPEARYAEIARLGWQAAEAMRYAHQRGVIHRDIKPSNLILDDLGTLWLTDFGLAKTDDEELTQTGEFLGTLRYMAPERFRGECDVRADIYSLGITLYELVTLRPAFRASDRLRLIEEIAHSQPADLSTVVPRIPRDLATIIHKTIDKVPSSRYQTAAELADDLKRFLDDQPIQARRNSSLELLARWARRNRSLATSLAALAATLVLVAVGSTIGIIRESALRKQALSAGLAAQHAQVVAEERGEQVRQTLYFAEMNLAGQAANGPGGTRQILAVTQRWEPTAETNDPRGWEWFYLRTLCMNEGTVLTSAPDVPHSLFGSWSPDGSRIALAHEAVGLSLWGVETGSRLEFWDAVKPRAVAWSPDGSRIATGGTDQHLSVRDAITGEEIVGFDTHYRIDAVAWHPAGSHVACGAGELLYLGRIDELPATTKLAGGTEPVNVLQWSPSGSRIACGNWWHQQMRIWDIETEIITAELPARFVKWSGDGLDVAQWLTSDDAGTISVWDATTGNRIERLMGHYGEVRSLAWNQSGTHLASASSDRTCRVWNVAAGRCVRSFHGHTDEVYDVEWKPDDKQLLSTSIEGSARIWQPIDAVRQVLSGHDKRVRAVRWNPNGTRLASASDDGSIRLWGLSAADPPQVLTGHDEWVHAVAWHPDGTQLASGGPDGVIVWDATSGRKLQQLREPNMQVLELDWSPDGSYLATIGTDAFIHIWRVASGEIAHRLEGHGSFGHTVRWSPQGDRLASAGENREIKIWDAQTFQLQQRLTGHRDDVVGIAWKRDGRQLVSGSRDETAKVWDLASGVEIRTFTGHHGAVWSVSWNRDGSRIATGSRDGSVKLWDASSGKQALTLRDSTGGVWCVAWNSTGQRLAAGDSGGTVAIWDATSAYEEWSQAAERGPTPSGERQRN